MPTEAKQKTVEELTKKVKDAKAVYLTDYRGLSVNNLQKLRNQLREQESEIQITKNTLLTIALKNNKSSVNEELSGPTATLFAYSDEVTPLKTVIEFAKTHDDLPKLKLGVLEGTTLNLEQLQQLATLPDKQTLRAQLVGTLQAPIQNFVYSLNYHTLSFVNVINNIKDKKENN